MGFKLSGMNFGKGTGSTKGFSKAQDITFSNTRSDPTGRIAKMDQEFYDKHGYYPFDQGQGQGQGSGDDLSYEELRQRGRDSETNQMMFNDLTGRLEEYKNDPFRVEVGPMDAYFPTSKKTGKKLKPPKGMMMDWILNNAEELNKKYGHGTVKIKNGKVTSFGGDAEGLYNQKINEAINIDNDLKMSAEQGYGFNEEQLQDFGVYGMDEFGFNPNVQGGGDYTTTQDLSAYAPNPVFQGNIEKNKENLQIENIKRIGNERINRIKKAIKKGKDIPASDLSWLASRGPQYDIPEFNQFIHDYVMPYQQHTAGSTRKSNKQADKLQDLLDSGMSIDQAYAELNMTAPSTEGKTISFSNDTRPSKMGGQLLDKFENNNDVGSDRFLWDDSPGLDLSADGDGEHTDEFTDMVDSDITDLNQNEFVDNENVDDGSGEGGGEGDGEGDGPEETETKEPEFDPEDFNKDGVVDYLDKRMGPPKTDSAYAKWNNKKMESMAKETLMNADSNPFKFGSKEHEEYTNNKSRAKGLAIKRKYRKFL